MQSSQKTTLRLRRICPQTIWTQDHAGDFRVTGGMITRPTTVTLLAMANDYC